MMPLVALSTSEYENANPSADIASGLHASPWCLERRRALAKYACISGGSTWLWSWGGMFSRVSTQMRVAPPGGLLICVPSACHRF